MPPMEEDGGLIYGLEFQCRALCPVAAEPDTVQFVVGTLSLKADNNQLHHLTLDEDTRTLSKQVYQHPAGEIWDLEPSPTDPNLLVSRHSVSESGGTPFNRQDATLWSLKGEGAEERGGGGFHELTRVCSLALALEEDPKDAPPRTDTTCVKFAPGQGDRAMSLVANKLLLHDLNECSGQKSKVVAAGCLESKSHGVLSVGTWNPHQNCQTFVAVNDYNVRAWDIRSMQQAWHFESPGHYVVRCLDFNPNKQYHLATAGDDGHNRFWDIRSPAKPLLTQSCHSHWVWSVAFNHFHDQLVLSASSDSHVVLSSLASISSEPHGQLVDDDEEDGRAGTNKVPVLADGILKTFEDHEESVYSAAWSSADPWIFASLSYDGRLVVNQVPRAVKFKILNLV